ncbi:site-specific integrase, partial [Streptococcus thermophilus]|nr:site-specific integrase [Streptococcus thermophilus]
LDKLTTPLIQSTMNKLANSTNTGVTGAYLHYDKIHALNKRILQYGVVLQVIPTNPANNVVLPRNTQKDKKAKVKHFNNDE